MHQITYVHDLTKMTKRKSLASALRVSQASALEKRARSCIESATKQKARQARGVREERLEKVKTNGKPLIPFTKDDKILFVGEGNFSFAVSCIENHLEHGENVLATSYDSKEELISKYPEAQENLTTIEDCCGSVQHSIDATKLHKHFPSRKFDSVIFMFPHVAAGIAEEDRNVLTNQKMLSAFFESVQHVLDRHAKVAVTLATSKTYDLWDLKGLAKAKGLIVQTSGPFIGSVFPGYEHRRTHKVYNQAHGFTGGRGEERSARWTFFAKPEERIASGKSPKRKNHSAQHLSDSDDE